MANGPALTPEEEYDPIGALAGEMKVDLPGDPKYQGESGEGRLASDVAKYKDETGDIDLDGKKDGLWKRAKTWWNKGAKDDPTTIDVDEGDPDTQVTKFMGGMTRQELGMFIFEWGGLMMQNADQGFGGAMGAAGLGAMQGHMGRQELGLSREGEAHDRALKEREVAAREYETKVGSNNELLERVRQEDGSFRWEPVKDADGEIITIKDPGNRPYQGLDVWQKDQLRALGYDDDMIAEIQSGAMSPQQTYDRVFDDLLTRKGKALEKETMNLPASMRVRIRNLEGKMVPIGDIEDDELAEIAKRIATGAMEQRGALRPNAPKSGEDYIQ